MAIVGKVRFTAVAFFVSVNPEVVFADAKRLPRDRLGALVSAARRKRYAIV